MVSTSKLEYVQSGQLVAASYVKNSKAIGFLWGIFSICYAIITIVVFIQPQWIGTRSPAAPGYFGLWRHCSVSTLVTDTSANTEFLCRGRLDDFATLLNPAFRAATAFIGIATIVTVLSVFALVLFVCAPTTVAYHIVAWMQTVSAVCTGVGLVVFPVGWDAPEVKATCGTNADKFDMGTCGIRWAYILAVIGLMDGIVLAILGFVLGSRHIKLTDEFPSNSSYGTGRKLQSVGGSYPGGGYYHPTDSGPTPSVTMSYASTKRSMNLQPIVLIPPDPDCYSEFSRSNKASLYRAEYATPSQNFQL